MSHKTLLFYVFFTFFLSASFFCACSSPETVSRSSSSDAAPRMTNYDFLIPDASGNIIYGDDTAQIDASNTSDGYLMIRYNGSSDKAKIQITHPDSTVYSYNLSPSEDYAAFPLSGGNGSYQINILEHAYDSMYALLFSQILDITIDDEFSPYLYPNQYVWFTPDTDTVQFGIELSNQSTSDLDYVSQIYNYITTHISYDQQAAENISTGYLPDIDHTLHSGKGVCFDYASIMAALLRSQCIPTKLVVGYSGTAYHAWISVYLTDIGWVDNIIEFDGQHWSLMDPTLAASNNRSAVKSYIGDGSNYTVKFSY